MFVVIDYSVKRLLEQVFFLAQLTSKPCVAAGFKLLNYSENIGVKCYQAVRIPAAESKPNKTQCPGYVVV